MATATKRAKVTRLEQPEVDQYVQICANIKALEKERDKMKPAIVQALESGQECPSAGPYLLAMQYADKPPGWKDICQAVLGTLKGEVLLAAAGLVARMQADTKEVGSLVTKPNPDWAG